jgi:hypothetical protein
MQYKCLHYRYCKRYVDFISGKGWVHMPENRAYCMEHQKLNKKRLASYNSITRIKRSQGCGWRGIQPADKIIWDTDICPGCGAQGELADHHIASPSYPKRRGRKPQNGRISKQMMRKAAIAAKRASGACSPFCMNSTSAKCICSCGGANHGIKIQLRLF